MEDLNSDSDTLEVIMRHDLPQAEEIRRWAEKSGQQSDYRLAMKEYCKITDKFGKLDSPDIFLFGFGFECYKSAIFLQLFLDENSDALSLAGNMTYGEVKYLKISIEPELELKLTSGLTVDDDFLKVLPMKNYSNVRFQIFILSAFLLIKIRHVKDLQQPDWLPNTFRVFIQVLESSTESSVHKKLSKQVPAIVLIRQHLVEELRVEAIAQIVRLIELLTSLIQSNIINRSTEIRSDETWIILDESIRILEDKNCHVFGSQHFGKKNSCLKEVISKVQSMGEILYNINFMWGKWTMK